MQANDLTDRSAHDPRGQQSADTPPARLRIEHRALEDVALPAGLLAVVRFVSPSRWAPDPRFAAPGEPAFVVDVRLAPLQDSPTAELWFASGPVRTGRSGIIRYAHDDHFLFAAIEEDERSHGGIGPASEAVYTALSQFQQHSRFPHVLRMWNYVDAINEGPGDLERYRQFCVGRARAVANAPAARYPAATAIGHQSPTQRLQVFWVAGRVAGTAVENPRQVSAYHYPRAHGPVSPSFSRATVARDGTVLISGTASIVGHVSQHPGDALEQLEETLRNLSAVTLHSQKYGGASAARDLLKVYLRDPALVQPVAARLAESHPGSKPIILAADICRRELLLEIECVRSPATP